MRTKTPKLAMCSEELGKVARQANGNMLLARHSEDNDVSLFLVLIFMSYNNDFRIKQSPKLPHMKWKEVKQMLASH